MSAKWEIGDSDFWAVDGRGSFSHYTIMEPGNSCPVALVPGPVEDDPEHAKRARLIAAAPDLLAALTELLNGDHPNRQYVAGHPAAEKARAAIAKATGAA